MINTGKKDLIISYVGYALKILSNIIILPVVLSNLSSSEYGLWIIFLAFGSLTVLLDLGFGTIIVRYTTYSYCGAKNIPKYGTPEMNDNGEANYLLLFLVLLSAKKIYKYISLIASLMLFIASLYIIYLSVGMSNQFSIIVAWGIYASGVVISIYFLYYTCIYKGLGKVKELQRMNIVNQLVYIALILTLLSFDFGLLGLAISNLVVSILLRFQISTEVKRIIKDNIEDFLNAKKEFVINFKETFNSILHHSKGIGGILVSNFIQNQGIILVLSIFLSLETVAVYGLSLQLIGIIATLASIPFKTFLPRMSSLQLSSNTEKLKDIYSYGSISAFIIFFLSGTFLLIFGDRALLLIESPTALLPSSQLLILILYSFIVMNNQRSTDFIQISNVQPYIKSYIISSLSSLILSILLLLLGFEIWGVLLTNLIVQSIYNGWKWPYEAMKMSEVRFTEMVIRTLKIIKVSKN